jgi:squalene synthase HpnC
VVDGPALRRAYDHCLRLARDHYENFPVASHLLPARMRPHVAALYAFARLADDLADEGTATEETRLARLADWRARLWACVEQRPDPGAPGHEEVFLALGATVRACALPPQWLDDLLSAFAQDVTTRRYATWADVLDYCRRSANPVGRLVLRIAGRDDPDADRASDEVCSALQLANFWQDFALDWSRGRLYVPAEIHDAHGATTASLDPSALTPAWVAALRDCCARTRGMFLRGRRVCDAVEGRLRLELRLTWLGGMRILDRVEAAGFDVARRRPALGARDALPLAWGLVRWPAALPARHGQGA